MSNINQGNEDFSGRREFTGFTESDRKDVRLRGSDGEERLVLNSLDRHDNTAAFGNPNLLYFGYDGFDSIRYHGSDLQRIDMRLNLPNANNYKSGFEFVLSGGYNLDYESYNSELLKSLDVYTLSVEKFVLTEEDDTVLIHGSSFGVEVSGEEGRDYFELTNHIDAAWGGSGSDTIYGFGGADIIYGEEGNDIIHGGTAGRDIASANQLFGKSGNDTIYGYDSDSTRISLDVVDVINGGSDHDLIHGFDGADLLDGGTGADTIYGGEGDDIISSGSLMNQSNSDELYGGAGADTFIISDGSNTYNSAIELNFGYESANSWTSILDAAGTVAGLVPVLKGPALAAKGIAASFDAFYQATSNGTSVSITAANFNVAETLVQDFNPFEDQIIVPISFSSDSQSTGVNTNYEFSWESVDGGVFSLRDKRDIADHEILKVNWADDLGQYVPEFMKDPTNANLIDGEYLDGLKESLKESYLTYTGGEVFLGGTLQSSGLNGAIKDQDFSYIAIGAFDGWRIIDANNSNNLWVGSGLNDVLGGFRRVEDFPGTNFVAYDADPVYLYGMGGDDILYGGAGHDVLNGGENPDGSRGSDTAAYYGAESVNVNLNDTRYDANKNLYYALSSATYRKDNQNVSGPNETPDYQTVYKVDTDNLYDIENIIGSDGGDRIIGDALNNILSGENGGDHMEGGAGDDILHGGNGWDRMFGDRHNGTHTSTDGNDTFFTGQDSDLIIGGGGSNTANFSDADAQGITINLTQTHASASHWFFKNNATSDTYVKVNGPGFGTSMSGIQNIVATAGNDRVIGDAQDNIITGGEGNDVLTGNGGADVFVFGSTSGWDTVTDFSKEDSLVFEGISQNDLNVLNTYLDMPNPSIRLFYLDTGVSLTGVSAGSLVSDTVAHDDDTYTVTLTMARYADPTPLSDYEAAL